MTPPPVRGHVDLVAPPMRGHLHPVLGIADAITRHLPGVEVRVLSTARAQPEITASGLTGVALLPGADERIDAIVEPARPVRANPALLLDQFRANLDVQADFQRELLARWPARPPDLVIADFTLFAAGGAAQRLGLPWWTAHPSPAVIEGRTGPPAYLGGLRPGRGPLGRARDATGRGLVRAFKRLTHRLWRTRLRALGFPAVYRADGSEAAYSPERVLALLPGWLDFDRGVAGNVSYVGPILHTPPGSPPPPRRPGHRHVLVTAGTHLAWYKDVLVAAAARTAAALPDVEVHVSLGAPGPGRACGPPNSWVEVRACEPRNLTVLPFVAYDPYLSGYDLVVHHGGGGVLGHALAAGVPSVVCPVDFDQFDGAARLTAAGLALRARLAQLPDRVAAALDDRDMAARVRDGAERLSTRPADVEVARLVRERLSQSDCLAP